MRRKLIPILALASLMVTSCKVPSVVNYQENPHTPATYQTNTDTVNVASRSWREYFKDPNLIALIDTALQHNQELNILAREIEMDKNEVLARKGEYLPFVNLTGATGIDKSGKYTWNGLSEEDWKKNPERKHKYLGDNLVTVMASWELDVWKKLHNAKKSAVLRYLASTEGRNFAQTYIIAEIADSYYELQGLDNLLVVVNQNIELQKNALKLVNYEKEAAKVTELAVKRFEAQLYNTENLQFEIKQRIVEAENRIHYLTGQFPHNIARTQISLNELQPSIPPAGVPSQLLANRPDIRQAELSLAACKLDVQVARANFLPSFRLSAGIGLNAFNPAYLLDPASILYSAAGDMVAPLVNKNAIKATYRNASLKQTTAAINYERTILNAYIEVLNDLNQLENYQRSAEVKSKEVEILTQSVAISGKLFSSARADYIEVLLTQREALNSKIELIEIKLRQLQGKVSLYRSLGGGWN